ncbi:SIS domain-containing protein [Candidatus Methanoprimaticola sp. MG2]|uniref:SIS domain-containing protein n=1 Tax=Candidatus Methanoprimaticola sp. MG2 TaxID=3228838 RepID=UPI0039C646F8
MTQPDGLLENIRLAVGSVDPDSKESLIASILEKRKVFIYGSGRSGLVGQLFAVRLVQLGLDVHFVGEMTTPIIGKEDLTILISFTGKTSSVVQTAEIARHIGSETVCITGTASSPLTGTSDVSLIMEVPESEEIRKTAPLGTIFEDSALILFDIIVAEIMERKGISEQDMRYRHAIWV